MVQNSIKKSNWSIFLIAFIVFALWQFPFLGMFRYPFILLGTWFHEMGHGLTSIFLGADFQYLEIYENGGGVAYTSYPSDAWAPYNLSRALVAAGGLLGPTLVGGLLVISASKVQWSRWALRGLIVLMVISMVIWVRSIVGISVLAAMTAFLTVISYQKRNALTKWTLLFLGVQCTLSTCLQLDYLFTGQFERNGQLMTSDTQTIADHLFGTYWMWAIVIIVISVYILWKSYRYYLKHSTTLS